MALTLALRPGQRRHQADDGGRAAHIALHLVHAGARLERDAAGVEGDALADKADRLLALRAAIPFHDDQLAFLDRALTDAQKRAHAQLRHLFFAKNLNFKAELGEIFDLLGVVFRAEHVGRFHHQIAGDVRAVGDGAPALPGGLRRADIAGDDFTSVSDGFLLSSSLVRYLSNR
jgi:hypothetical protein